MKNRSEVLKISFSAFFADLGYQSAVAAFPIVFVVYLGAPIFLYGFAESLNYGVGTAIAYLGGRLGDKIGRKKIAVIGNTLILFVSLLGIARDYIQALIFFMIGWWARNLRTPPRRAMLAEVTLPEERAEAYGILHSLDIAGAMLSIIYLAVLLFLRIPLVIILSFTAIWIVISTIILSRVRAGYNRRLNTNSNENKRMTENKRLFWTIIISTFFFGFSQYSFGFPIITTTEITGKDYLGVISYGVFLGASSLFGYIFGKSRVKEISGLAFLGYLIGAIASLGFAFLSRIGLVPLYSFSFLMGIAVAATETFEPTIISKIVREEAYGSGMGYLSAGRSIGIFIGNTVMGFLYSINFAYAYIFASLMSLISFTLILLLILREKTD
ncbi:MAG: MFS transporter [Saccharolobus sp.]